MKKILILPIFLLLITSCVNTQIKEKTVNEQNNEVSSWVENIDESNTGESINDTELSPDEEKMINDILDI